MEINSSIGLKHLNHHKVYSYLYEVKSSSKLEISRGTGLSIPTVASNIVELERRGLVSGGQACKSTGGRRAQSYSINRTSRIAIGVEILKEEIKVVAVDLYGEIIAETRTEVEFSNNDNFFTLFGSFVNGFIASLDFPDNRILGIGISLQGLVSEDGETVIYSKILNATGLTLETFRRLFRYKCRMFHDTGKAALAEIWNSHGIRNAIYLVLNRNFGGALILNGEVGKEQRLAGATIEHMRINPDGPLCYCGHHGCAEAYCGANRFRDRYGLEVTAFFEGLHAGDESCKRIWEEYARNLAIVINNVNMVVSCDIIIGGYLLRFMDDNDFNFIIETARAEGFSYGSNNRIIRSRLEDKAPALGAAIDFIEQFINEV